jgi:hypothetical protein
MRPTLERHVKTAKVKATPARAAQTLADPRLIAVDDNWMHPTNHTHSRERNWKREIQRMVGPELNVIWIMQSMPATTTLT